MSGDSVTVLRAHDSKRMTKKFYVATNGNVGRLDYDSATWFTAESVPVASLLDLYATLRRIEADPVACVIRGAPVDGANMARTRRKKAGPGAPFTETPRRWLMLDIDGLPMPGISVLDDPAEAAQALLDLLAAHAPELEGVSAIVQFSSSAGLDELHAAETAAGMPPRWLGVVKRGVAAHVWFWLEQPVGEAALKRWMTALAAGGLTIDQCTNRTVQVHYTAAPLFSAPLRDPLAGRRTVLINGWQHAAELRIPAVAPRPAQTGNAGAGGGSGGLGYVGHLAAIGGADGFRAPMLKAVCAYLSDNGTDADTAPLKTDLRNSISAADPGARSDATITIYESDAHIDAMIAWVRTQQEDEQTARQAEAAQPVEPTFPDRGVTLAESARQVRAALAGFGDKIAAGDKPETLLRLTVGAGKSEGAIAALPDLLAKARAAGRDGAAYYFFPRHALADELITRIRKMHPTLKVEVWRGMEQPDHDAPANDRKRTMCADLELSSAAMKASQSAIAGCKICPWFPQPGGSAAADVCGYMTQRGRRPDVWLMPHNLLFQQKPVGLPDAAIVIVDESFAGTALRGMDALNPVQIAVSALGDNRTGSVTGGDRERLLYLRHKAAAAIEEQTDEGGLLRDNFIAAGFAVQALGATIPDVADEWLKLEWATKPQVKITKGMDRSAAISAFVEAAKQGFTALRPALAERVRDMLKSGAARSVNASLIHNAPLGREQGTGDAIRFEWRENFAEWVAEAPKLFLDATTPAEVLRCWAPDIKVVDIEVKAPGQRVRQVVGAEFGRSRFTQNQNNVRRLGDLAVTELAATTGDVLVICQQAVEELLHTDMVRRFGTIPARLILAHHGAITGMNEWQHVRRIVIVGRPATNRLQGERLAEVMRGAPVDVVTDGEAAHWPTVTAGIRLADGTGRAVRQPRHPDALVEAVRWSISEGAVIQGIGRGRGVRRDPADPVHVTIMAELALPLTVAEVLTWDEALPDRVHVAAAEAALTGRALPLAAADLHAARPDMFANVAAAEHALRGRNYRKTLIEALYKGNAVVSGLTPARYRRLGQRGPLAHALVPEQGGRAALEAIVGALAVFETEHPRAPAIPIPSVRVFMLDYWRNRGARGGWMPPVAAIEQDVAAAMRLAA